jgi:shikimate dehydrogenase
MANDQSAHRELASRGKIGIIGYPARHSLSPIFQQAAFDAMKLDLQYEIWETHLDGLESLIESMQSTNVYGANVTMPYKETVIPLLDSIDYSAEIVGAVNTIVKSNGNLIGYNTDGVGFVEALTDTGFNMKGQTALILGAGGAARSIAFALAYENPSSIIIANRNEKRATALALSLKEATNISVIPIPLTETMMNNWVPKSDLLVNATSIGMHPQADISPIPDSLIHPDMFVYDLVYNPLETLLVKRARIRGAVATGGLSMLIYQGAHAFDLWTGIVAPRELMRQAAEAHIARLSNI